MVSLNHSTTHLTKAISDVEEALLDYNYYPLRGLSKLQSSLLMMQSATQSDDVHPLFHLRLNSLLASVKKLTDSGSPYDENYHAAFSSASDALFQTALADQFGIDHSLQLSHLLSVERDCWAKLSSMADVLDKNPVAVAYTAFLSADSFSMRSSTVEDVLISLSGIGEVSFHLTTSLNPMVSGYFKLITIQSLAWLKSRYPDLNWHGPVRLTEDSLRRLCELTFLPLFQNLTMPRASRAQLLAQFEHDFKDIHYQKFDTLFSGKANSVLNGHIRVPVERDFPRMDFDQSMICFPVYHGGYVYSACRPLNKQEHNQAVIYTACLGRDFLPHFLYEVSTAFGQCVFDQNDVHGRYTVEESDFQRDGDQLWLSLEGVRAPLLLSLPIFVQKDVIYCLLPKFVSNVIVIAQAGQYFALPYDHIRDVEGVCSRMQSPSAWVKNVWQTSSNAFLLEPLLFHFDNASIIPSKPNRKRFGKKDKSGYYVCRLGELSIWVDADLVSVILPYQCPNQFVWMNDRQLVPTAFIIQDGECFDKVLSQHTCYDSELVLDEPAEFSVVLECEEDTVVLPVSDCEWHASLPDEWISSSSARDIDSESKHSKPFDSVLFSNKSTVVTAENFVLFVAEFGPCFHQFKSDY